MPVTLLPLGDLKHGWGLRKLGWKIGEGRNKCGRVKEERENSKREKQDCKRKRRQGEKLNSNSWQAPLGGSVTDVAASLHDIVMYGSKPPISLLPVVKTVDCGA